MSNLANAVPTLYEWLGGGERLHALIVQFYEKVPLDPLLKPLFAGMPQKHFDHVAAFIGEVFGGPREYSENFGGHPHMIQKHLGKNITNAQRKRWMELLLETADELNLPNDPEFRSALVAYLEWGSRLAVINSAEPAGSATGDAPMPSWGWGMPGGPYQPDGN